MNNYKRLIIVFILAEIVLIVVSNLITYRAVTGKNPGIHRVEVKRVADELAASEAGTPEERISGVDLSEYETVTGISVIGVGHDIDNNDPYEVREIDSVLYRISYREQVSYLPIVLMNISLCVVLILTVTVLLYVYRHIILPFESLSELPYELAKGGISTPIREEKGRYFGRFIWGMDMLRERLEEDRRRNLSYERDKKTLLLSLSHDIKTPLQTLELYDRVLITGLYKSNEQRSEAYEGIGKNISEIKKYINDITDSLREDIVDVQMQVHEVYLGEVIESATEPYRDRLDELHVRFDMGQIDDKLISADPDRLVEVLQNLIENAIKYGDGRYIRLSQGEEEDCCLVEITSSGCDIKPEEVPHLAESFYRGSNSARSEGSGLGLYISRELMRRMDGDMYIEVSPDEFAVVVVVRQAG